MIMDGLIQHDADTVHLAPHIGGAFKIPIGKALLNSLDAHFFKFSQRINSITGIIALIGIHTQADLGPDGLPDQMHGADILLHMNTGLYFQDMEAILKHMCPGFLRHSLRCVNPNGNIVLNPVRIASKKLVNRLAHQFAADIVHCQIYSTFCGTVPIDASVHQLMDFFNIEWIHADKAGAEQADYTDYAVNGLAGDKRQRRGFSIAIDSLICGNLYQQVFRIIDFGKGNTEGGGKFNAYLFGFNICDFHKVLTPVLS